MAKQVTLTHFVKKPRIEINNYLEDQSVDRNGTTAGSENGAEINSEPEPYRERVATTPFTPMERFFLQQWRLVEPLKSSRK